MNTNLVFEFISEVRAGNAEAVRTLLDQHSHLVQETTEDGVSAVLVAAYHQHEEVLKLLVERKPKLTIFEAAAIGVPKRLNRKLNEDPSLLNSFSADGFTPLNFACFFNQIETVDMLLRKGAKVNQASKNDVKLTPLHGAVSAGTVQVARLVLENGAEVNARQGAGYTPLHQAAYNGHTQMVELLLHFGANPHLMLDNGKSPLDLAQEKGHEEVLKLLKNANGQAPSKEFAT